MEKNKLMLIIIIVLLVVLLGTIVGVAFYAVNVLNSGPVEEEQTGVETLGQDQIQIINLDAPVYTNLRKGADEKEHVGRVVVSVGVDSSEEESAEFITMLGERTVVIKDVVIGVLRDKTYDELRGDDAQETLRNEILEKLRKQFNSNLIVMVYISDLFVD